MMSRIRATHWILVAAFALAPGCGDEAEGTTTQRGAPATANSGKTKEKKGGGGGGAKPQGGGGGRQPAEAGPEPAPDHPKSVISRDDFSTETRDPFQRFLGNEVVDADEPRDVQRQREVRMPEYNFEDLTLIGIVMSGKRIRPRALFLASDGKSKSVRQGEYFSRAEVLLAAVNRDYIEIEVVDEELAKGLNMATGERRAIYLKKE